MGDFLQLLSTGYGRPLLFFWFSCYFLTFHLNGSGEVRRLFGGAVNGAIDPVAKCLDEAFDGLFGDSEARMKETEGFVHLCIHKEVFGFDVISGYLVDNLLRIGDEFIMVEVVIMTADKAKIILIQSL